MPSRALARGPAHDGGQQHDSILLLTCMSMTNKSRINLEPWVNTNCKKWPHLSLQSSSCLSPTWPSWHPKAINLSIQSFFGIQGQGRQVVELVKAKRGRPPKPRPAAQPAQEGLATAQQEGPEGRSRRSQQQLSRRSH